MMDALGVTFRDLFDRNLGLPIVNVDCQYQNPMFYWDELLLRTEVESLVLIHNDARHDALER
jgi:acyl-CoA thioesterase FadM